MGTLAVPDLARLARSTTQAAAMAERGEVSKVAADAFVKLVDRHGRYVDDLSTRLLRAHSDGRIGNPQEAAAALSAARAALDEAQQVLTSGTTTRQRVPFLKFLGTRSDASAGVAALRSAADELTLADTRIRAIPNTAVVDEASSAYVLRGDELGAVRGAAHQATDPADLTAGTRELLTFDRGKQSRISSVYDATVGRLFATRWHGADKIADGQHQTLGTLYLGSHMRIVDPMELIAGLRVRGAEPMRALGNNGVVRDFPILQRVGLFGITNKVGDEVVKAEELIPTLLDQGTSTLMFQDGTLVPLINGAVGEPRRGAALAASRTGAPIVHTATYGLQSKVDIGPLAAGRRPQTVVGDPLWIRRAEPGSSAEALDEQVYEVTELIAQRHERLQGEAFRRYADQ